MARQYKRDARGRFASGGSTGRRAGGTLAARASLRRSRQKLAAKDPADASLKGTLSGRAQRAAVTRANKRLQQASRASRVTIAGARGGTLRRPAGYKPRATPAASQAPRNIQGPKLQGVTRARLSGRKMSMGAGLRGKRRQERQQRMAIMDRWMAREGQSPSRAAVAALARKRRAEPLTLGGGTLAARGSLKRSRAKLRENDTPSQRGAVTRANRYAGMAIKRERVGLGQSVKGRYVRGKGRQAGPANSIRPTGRNRRQQPARGPVSAQNNIRPTGRNNTRNAEARQQRAYARRLGRASSNYQASQQALARAGGDEKAAARARRSSEVARRARDTYRAPKSAVKPYRPVTIKGKLRKIDRQVDRELKPLAEGLREIRDRARELKSKTDPLARQLERMSARDIANRNKKGITGEVARDVLAVTGTKSGRKAITRRMNRALTAAGRGSKPAQRAVRVYLDQLAGMGPGKPSRGRNNLRPGPRNTKGAPKRKRKGRGKG